MVETLDGFQDEVILHRASHLQLLGVMPIAVDGPHADRPHQQHADNRHQRQHRAQVAHHRQRDGADDPVGAQAVIQFDLLAGGHLPTGETAEDLAGGAFAEEIERVFQQARKPAAPCNNTKFLMKRSVRVRAISANAVEATNANR